MNKTETIEVLIVGEMPCCICGEMMSQKDVDSQQAILSTPQSKAPKINVIAHVRHFYTPDKQRVFDYELSITKFALAVAKDRGDLPVYRYLEAKAKIAKLEKKYAD